MDTWDESIWRARLQNPCPCCGMFRQHEQQKRQRQNKYSVIHVSSNAAAEFYLFKMNAHCRPNENVPCAVKTSVIKARRLEMSTLIVLLTAALGGRRNSASLMSASSASAPSSHSWNAKRIRSTHPAEQGLRCQKRRVGASTCTRRARLQTYFFPSRGTHLHKRTSTAPHANTGEHVHSGIQRRMYYRLRY